MADFPWAAFGFGVSVGLVVMGEIYDRRLSKLQQQFDEAMTLASQAIRAAEAKED